MTNIFIQPKYEGQQALIDAMNRDDVETLQPMIIAAALYEEDLEFVQNACIRLSSHLDEIVRGNAVLGFGHLARLFGRLGDEGVTIVKRALQDPSRYVRGQANAAADDLEQFLGADVRDHGSPPSR